MARPWGFFHPRSGDHNFLDDLSHIMTKCNLFIWKSKCHKAIHSQRFIGQTVVDKAPRLSISIIIRTLSSDTISQLNQFNTNSEVTMLSKLLTQ